MSQKKKSPSKSRTSQATSSDSQNDQDQTQDQQPDQTQDQSNDLVKERDQTYRPTAVAEPAGEDDDSPDGLKHPTPAEQAMHEDQEKANKAQEEAKEARDDQLLGVYRPEVSEGEEEPQSATDHRHFQQAEPKGRIIEPGDPVEFDGTRNGNYITVNEDVYRKYYPRGARRPSYQLLYRKGVSVSALAVEALNEDQTGPGVV